MKYDQAIRSILPFVETPESIVRKTIPSYLQKNINRYLETLPMDLNLNEQVDQRKIIWGMMKKRRKRITEMKGMKKKRMKKAITKIDKEIEIDVKQRKRKFNPKLVLAK